MARAEAQVPEEDPGRRNQPRTRTMAGAAEGKTPTRRPAGAVLNRLYRLQKMNRQEDGIPREMN